MSIRLEYVSARSPVEYVNELALAEDLGVDNPEDRDVLVISYDECIVLVGTPEELKALGVRIISAVARGARPYQAKCPVCGAPMDDEGCTIEIGHDAE